jgi:oxygen-dependent protoporphyrinogen oxidase
VSRVIVVGAGIAGLALAHRLRDRHDVVVFEREAVAGGKMRSQSIDGLLFEWGPNGFLAGAAELRGLVRQLGLDDALVEADPAASKRAIYWHGKLHALPAKPPQLLGISLLSPFGKLRALAELVRPRGGPRDDDADESVTAFFRRRFGSEVAERIAAPALLGISGGDAARTGAAALFPRLVAYEREHGSVIRGMLRARARPGRLHGFGTAGMQLVADRLAAQLGARLRLSSAVQRIERAAPGWRVHHDGGSSEADALVLALPADAAASLAATFDPPLADALARIPYAPMRAIGIAFRAADVRAPLDGFGFLVARGETVRILGALYTSTIFPTQAPPGTVYLRVFVGGAVDPEAAALDAAAVRALVRADLATTLGITAEPLAYHEVVWPQAIPQYGLAHRAIVRAIATRAAAHPGLVLVGNAYRGIGLGDVVRDALTAADALSAPSARS